MYYFAEGEEDILLLVRNQREELKPLRLERSDWKLGKESHVWRITTGAYRDADTKKCRVALWSRPLFPVLVTLHLSYLAPF
jgi:hypothetical protein